MTPSARLRRPAPAAVSLGSAVLVFSGITALAAPARRAPRPAAKPAAAPVQRVDFNRDIRPILSSNCFACHGVDANKRTANLRLDTAEGLHGALPNGHRAVVPGKPAASELWKRVVATNALRMPPASTGKELKPEEIAKLKRWIEQGAPFAPHWAYAPLKPQTPPAVRQAGWALNPVDGFILARLERERVKPSPEADRATLFRRLSLDLTGLQPTPQELDAFLADRAPNAYEKAVDQLLASPHYGERMAQYWLDLVRYADTVGYHGDQDVTVWPYRDYVIQAFNSNKRFDRFTQEQIAGDLLPGAGDEEWIASGYNRLGPMSAEGGVQDKEYRAKYAAERVRNTSTVWLGATLGCAECHDHKFDPLTTKEFYSFAAFFADLKEKGFYDGGYSQGDWGPSLKAFSPEQKAQLARLDTEIAKAREAQASVSDEKLTAGREQWEAALLAADGQKKLAWQIVKPLEATSSGGSTLTLGGDGTVEAGGKLPAKDTYAVTLPLPEGPVASVRVEALPDGELAGNGVSRAGYYFVLSEIEVARKSGAEAAQPLPLRSVAVNGEDEGYPGAALIDGRPETGWAIVHGGGGLRSAVVRLAEPVQGGPESRLVVRLRHETVPRLTIGKFRVSVAGFAADLSPQGLPADVLTALRKPAAQRSAEEQKRLAAHFRTVAPELAETNRRLLQLQGERSVLLGQVPHTLISEAGEPRVMRVLPRGNWMDDSGEVVQPTVPQALGALSVQGRPNRLHLANWLASAQNPLTARVFVNRLWKLFYGVGIAKNVDDFGAQGEPPVHPELLDWLSGEFIRSGWDVKHMVRLLVTSRTYRQSSAARPELASRDPFNRLHARQTPTRLDAEFIRDVALRAAGILSPKIGGRSVYPYQPQGYLAALNFPKREWATGAGEDLYRRALYTHWQRTFVHPSLLAFDAPTREECTASRIISNTPLQALVLLNDPIFVEAGRVFAERILREGGDSFEKRAPFAFRTALSRSPRKEEVAVLQQLYTAQRARYAADREAAEKLVRTGDSPPAPGLDPVEVAAWTGVARAILNLHEAITRS